MSAENEVPPQVEAVAAAPAAAEPKQGKKEKKAKEPKEEVKEEAKVRRAAFVEADVSSSLHSDCFRYYFLFIFPPPTQSRDRTRARSQEEVRVAPVVEDHNSGQFGDLRLIQSRYQSGRVWTPIKAFTPELAEQQVWVRARIHTNRSKGKSCFLVLREGCFTAQACMFVGDAVPADMIKYAGKLPGETVVDVFGTICKVEKPIESCTQTLVELSIAKIFCVSLAHSRPPFSVTDAARSDADIEAAEARGDKMVRVNMDTRLDNRVLDLRTPANNSIFRMQSAVGNYFREYFLMNDFVEIHSPKIIPGVSEGGANVFKLGYFGNEACLAQSPQLYKQMSVLGDLARVFEIGPVFRAEDSNTHRHLCEFVGLDFEMEIKEHYHEVLDALGNAFIHIFDRINERMQAELAIINKQHPFEPLKYLRKTLVLHHEDAVQVRDCAFESVNILRIQYQSTHV